MGTYSDRHAQVATTTIDVDPRCYFFCITVNNFVHCLPTEAHVSCV